LGVSIFLNTPVHTGGIKIKEKYCPFLEENFLLNSIISQTWEKKVFYEKESFPSHLSQKNNYIHISKKSACRH
jgi:hypothetical protein